MKKIAILFTTLCLLQSVHAQTITSVVPGYISYQGRALDTTGAVIGLAAPVNRTVTFRVWDHPSNVLLANLLYSEQQTVTISGGEFSVLIGQGAATAGTTFGYSEASKGPGGSPVVTISDLAVFGGSTRYLGVTIDDGTVAADNEITPRQQIVSSAFAFRAKYAEQLGSNGRASLTTLDSGNVGIGNTAPPALFTVSGANTSTTTSTPQLLVTADDITERLRIGVDSTGTGTGFIQSFKEGTGVQNLLLNPSGGNVGIGTTSPAVALSVTGAITATGAITGGSFSTAGAITGGSLTTNTGNIGIGTTTPVARLDIIDGTTSGTYGSAQISRPATGHTGSHLAFVRAGGQVMGVGYAQSSPTFGFGGGTSGAFSPNILAIDGNGNVGIGTAAPGFPLNLSNAMGDKIALWGNSGNTSGFGIQSNLLQIHTDTSAGDVGFGYGSSAAMTETMRIKGNGNVGIGTTSPGTKLQIDDGASDPAKYGSLQINRPATGHTAAHLSFVRVGVTAAGLGYGQSVSTFGFGPATTGTFSPSWLGFDTFGNVQIGTTSNQARLNIGTSSGTYAIIGYLDTGGGQNGDTASTTYNNTSIFADGRIIAPYVGINSDLRIKTDLHPSDSGKDLATLMGIAVTDYHLKDKIANGNGSYKKAIAQQLEKVYPQAVNTTKGVVPDIYQKAKVQDGWVALATDLKVGDRVRLISDKEEGVHEVLKVKADRFLTNFKTAGGQVFVYGREVNDFRSVDYDALSMLNVSATQELARKLKSVQDENAALRRELAAKDATVEARLIALEQRLTKGSASETVSIKTANAAN